MRSSSLVLLGAFASVICVRIPLRRVPRLSAHAHIGNILTTDLAVTNRNQFAYLLPVSVGGQEFSVVFDTGSSDFWVVSSECSSSDCIGVSKYRKNHSSSLSMTEHDFKLGYLVGSVTGTIGFETIRLGSLEISSQVFALVHDTQGLGLSSTGNSGILGLSFPSIASISPSAGSPILDNILSPFDEQHRFFAFKLGRGLGVEDISSSITVGELDDDLAPGLSVFSFTPVSKAGADTYNYWKLPLQSLTVDRTTFHLSPSLVSGATTQIAVLDTGTTLILGPSVDVNALWRSVDSNGATRQNKITGLWEIRCDRGISVSFVLGDRGHERSFPVDPSDINWKEGGEGEDWCLGGVQVNDGVNSGDWLLGDVFLRNVYVTHHLGNSTHPPFIGLLSMTDETISLQKFRKLRGLEHSHGSSDRNKSDSTQASQSKVLVYGISSICGFVVGAAITLSLRSGYNRLPFC